MTESTETTAPVAPAADAPKKTKKSPDAEFVALKRISGILGALNNTAKRRVLSYFVDRAIPA